MRIKLNSLQCLFVVGLLLLSPLSRSYGDDGSKDTKDLQRLEEPIAKIEAGKVLDAYKWTVDFAVKSESDANKAFDEFLAENAIAQTVGKKMSFFPIRFYHGYYCTAVKDTALPYLLFAKKGGKTVYMYGGNP